LADKSRRDRWYCAVGVRLASDLHTLVHRSAGTDMLDIVRFLN